MQTQGLQYAVALSGLSCGDPLLSRRAEFSRPHVKYRCHVCRLDLRFDPVLRRMEIAPFDVDSHEESASRKGTDLEG
jgi:hypothetical protein